MKNRHRICNIAFVLALAVSVCACGSRESSEPIESQAYLESESSNNNMEENKIMLTERQKEILQEMGLPEDYAALTDSQKSAITNIERALSYLEDSYGEEFVYDGYAAGGLDGQYLTAYAKNDAAQKIVTVNISYKNGEYHYTDDYQLLRATEEYQEALEQQLRSMMNEGGACWVHAELNSFNESDEFIIKKASGGVLVFVQNIFDDYEDAKGFVEQYGEWIKSLECDYQVGASFYFQDSNDYSSTNSYNYQDAIRTGKYVYYFRCSVSQEGKIIMYEE